jgi:hypothetical protein
MFTNFVSPAAERFPAKNLLLKNTPSLSENLAGAIFRK